MGDIFRRLKDLMNFYFYILLIGAGGFTLYFDVKALKKKNLKREEKICKGLTYFVFAFFVVIFIITKFIL